MMSARIFCLFLFATFTLSTGCADHPQPSPRILVFSLTKGFRHSSIAAGHTALRKLGQAHGFAVDSTENPAFFTNSILQQYRAVVFLHPTGDVLNAAQEAAFERYIRAGGGFAGVHGAADCEYDWQWYGRLVGGYFHSHPEIQEALLQRKDKKHPATAHLPDVWTFTDEWYNFKPESFNRDVAVLLNIDENSYTGGNMGEYHPVAWYHSFEGGRAFYTNLGHRSETWQDERFLLHLLGGIRYAMGQ